MSLRLYRFPKQAIVVNGNVTIRIHAVDLQTGQVDLAIDAPRYVPVDREEIHTRRANSVKRHLPSDE